MENNLRIYVFGMMILIVNTKDKFSQVRSKIFTCCDRPPNHPLTLQDILVQYILEFPVSYKTHVPKIPKKHAFLDEYGM